MLSNLPKDAPLDLKQDILQVMKLREEGLCGVLVEDHSICIRPANDGHRHGGEWHPAATSAEHAREVWYEAATALYEALSNIKANADWLVTRAPSPSRDAILERANEALDAYRKADLSADGPVAEFQSEWCGICGAQYIGKPRACAVHGRTKPQPHPNPGALPLPACASDDVGEDAEQEAFIQSVNGLDRAELMSLLWSEYGHRNRLAQEVVRLKETADGSAAADSETLLSDAREWFRTEDEARAYVKGYRDAEEKR